MTPRLRVRRQIRGFVTAWTALTGMIAVATFFAIYLTYGGGSISAGSRNIAIPLASSTQQVALNVTTPPTLQVVAASTNTLPAPTQSPTQEVEADANPQVAQVAQAAETEESAAEGEGADTVEAEPTTPPIEVTEFQAGIQVQRDLARNRANMDNWMREVGEKMGFGWFKLQVRWEEMEIAKGDYEFGELRFVLNSAKKFGLKVMVSVVTTPEWAREPGVDLSNHGPPADYQDYVDFVSEMLNRFGGDIHAIEVWNEQNLDREWMSTGGLSAQNYVNLLRQTYQAVKAIDPNIIVISGALSPGGGYEEAGVVTAVDDFVYLDGLIQAGMLDYADCVGVHHNGYNIGPSVRWDEVENDPDAEFRGPFENPHHTWSFRSTLEEYNRKIQLAGGTQKLCVTEFGWAVTEDLEGTPRGFEFANDNTLEEQATWTIEALDNMQEWDFVWLAFIWNFNYGPQAGWGPTNDNVPYSIIGPDWVHRPVYGEIIEWQQARLEAGLP